MTFHRRCRSCPIRFAQAYFKLPNNANFSRCRYRRPEYGKISIDLLEAETNNFERKLTRSHFVAKTTKFYAQNRKYQLSFLEEALLTSINELYWPIDYISLNIQSVVGIHAATEIIARVYLAMIGIEL